MSQEEDPDRDELSYAQAGWLRGRVFHRNCDDCERRGRPCDAKQDDGAVGHVYVVMGGAGAYSSEEHWPVAAYKKRQPADEHGDNAVRWVLQNGRGPNGRFDIGILQRAFESGKRNPYDPGMTRVEAREGPNYYTLEVPWAPGEEPGVARHQDGGSAQPSEQHFAFGVVARDDVQAAINDTRYSGESDAAAAKRLLDEGVEDWIPPHQGCEADYHAAVRRRLEQIAGGD